MIDILLVGHIFSPLKVCLCVACVCVCVCVCVCAMKDETMWNCHQIVLYAKVKYLVGRSSKSHTILLVNH